jgi:hypothetical protein
LAGPPSPPPHPQAVGHVRATSVHWKTSSSLGNTIIRSSSVAPSSRHRHIEFPSSFSCPACSPQFGDAQTAIATTPHRPLADGRCAAAVALDAVIVVGRARARAMGVGARPVVAVGRAQVGRDLRCQGSWASSRFKNFFSFLNSIQSHFKYPLKFQNSCKHVENSENYKVNFV